REAGRGQQSARLELATSAAGPPRPAADQAGTGAARPVSAGRRVEDDHRDLPGGLGFVVRETRVLALLPVPDAVPFRAFGHPGDQWYGLGPDLRAHLGVSQQIVVPVRVGGGADLGREDGITAGDRLIHHWVDP